MYKRVRKVRKENLGQYQKGLVSCLLWCAIGAGIGLLFAIALDSEMQGRLAEHLQSGVLNLVAIEPAPFTYFLKRCLTYAQLLLLAWGLEYFAFGYIGVRILLLVRGFLYGFGQVAWIYAYQVKGFWLGALAYWPHNLLFIVVIAWLEWMMQERQYVGHWSSKQIGLITAFLIPLLALVEAYIAPALLRHFL